MTKDYQQGQNYQQPKSCHHCGKPGHIKAWCFHNPQSPNYGKGKGKGKGINEVEDANYVQGPGQQPVAQ